MEIIEGVKIYSKLTIKTQKYVSDVLFIVKLGLISHLVFVYLLLILSMFLFNKICSKAQVLRLLHMPLETGRELNVHKSYKRSF